MIKFNGAQFAKLSSKLKKISWKTLKEKIFSALAICKQQLIKLVKVNWKSLPSNLWNKIKKVKLRKTSAYRFLKKFLKKLSDSWKIILTVVPLFLIFYYGLGSYVVENIDVKTEYKIEKNGFSIRDFKFPHVKVHNPQLEISSSEIRSCIQNGKAWRYLVSDAVFEYIKKRGLYGCKNGGSE